jgi:exosortase
MASVPTSLPSPTIEFDRPARIRAVIVGLAFAAVFYNELLNLQSKWYHSADWSHGWLIPLFSVYLVYLRWAQVKRAPLRHTWIGFVLMLTALVGYQYFLWVSPMGYPRATMMLLCLLGVVVALCGLPILRCIWVPWLYLFFAVPLPQSIYFSLTDPLRRLAAIVATQVLGLFGNLDIQKIGSNIEYVYQGQVGTLGVADACSGMRSTMTLCALGVAVAFISDRPWWQRVIMIASCIPIAVFSNFIRVTVTCILHIFVDPKYATGTYHTILGLVTLLIAFGIFSVLGWLLNHLFLEEPQPQATGGQNA